MFNIEKRNDNFPEKRIEDIAYPIFTIDFKEEVANDEVSANNLLNRVADALQGMHFADGVLSKDVEYVLNLNDGMKQALARGDLKLDTNKAGEMFAQFRNGNKFGKKVPIKKLLKSKGIDPMEVSTALQMKALQEQLQDIAAVLDDISNDISEVKHGQQNDRIALYFSGMNLYLEARNMKDLTFQKFMLAQAVKALSDANSQVLLEMHSDMQYLLSGTYKKKKGKSTDEIDERMQNINQCFEVIHRSAVLKAYIYYQQKEIPAMIQVLDEYGHFLNGTVAPNVKKLRQFDINDRLPEESIWEKRADSLLDLKNWKGQLTGTDNVLQIEDN